MEQWQYDHFIRQIHRTEYKRHENFVLGALIHDGLIQELLVTTQQYVRLGDEGYALVDIYFPQLGIAVEVDEPHHDAHRNADLERERYIRDALACDVIRIDVAAGDIPSQVKSLRNVLIERMDTMKSKGNWKPWVQPRHVLLDDLRKELERTMFIKICGEIHPADLMERQTGYWSIEETKRYLVQQVVVVHDGVVSRIFKDLEWRCTQPSNGKNKKWGYTGLETPNQDLIGVIVDGWSNQYTRIYSFDLY